MNEDIKSQEYWKAHHQPYELRYHKDSGVNWCGDQTKFWNFWNDIFAFIGINWNDIDGMNMLDVGCGPRPPLHLFRKMNNVFLIEPLGYEYQKISPAEWWEGITLFSQPAETPVPDLKDKMDFVMCWNCLDHTYDWKAILDNIRGYLKKDGIFAFAVDTKTPGIGHPSFPREELMEYINKHFVIMKEQKDFMERDLAFILRKI